MFRYMIEVFAKDIPKKILDCGAGGERPPLGLFYDHGFETFGIDISSSQLSLAQQFARQHQMELNLQESNLLHIPFENNAFGFVYSYNTLCHLRKEDIAKGIKEIYRVLMEGGLFFANFGTYDDGYYGEGKEIGEGEFELTDDSGNKRYRSFYNKNELIQCFQEFEVVFLEKKNISLPTLMKDFDVGYYCVIGKKK